jgi:predicted Zn-dependent protease
MMTTAKKALARDPADSDINLLMGEILVGQHAYLDAEPYLERSLDARPDVLPRVHALLGRVLAATGRPKEAIQELDQGLASDDDGSVHFQLARLYQQAGDAKAAAAALEKSKQIQARHDALAQQELMPGH